MLPLHCINLMSFGWLVHQSKIVFCIEDNISSPMTGKLVHMALSVLALLQDTLHCCYSLAINEKQCKIKKQSKGKKNCKKRKNKEKQGKTKKNYGKQCTVMPGCTHCTLYSTLQNIQSSFPEVVLSVIRLIAMCLMVLYSVHLNTIQ